MSVSDQAGGAKTPHVADGMELRHAPGGSWKRLTTLFSGVLKKAAAMELYSPSAQKSCEVGKENV